MPEIRVNGVDLFYVDQGAGPPVVFVHGAWMDLRYWEPQREVVAAKYHFIAYTLRYHGTARWPDDGQRYSTATHLADLTAFIRQLNAGPVHLVGLSMGGRLVNEVIAQRIPGRLVVIPEAAHLMNHQNPAAFNETLLHFLIRQ